MIDVREYETREDLEKAMYQMHRDQLVKLMYGKYRMINSDIERMLSLIQDPFANKCAALDRDTIYLTAEYIEKLAKQVAFACSIMKGACRFILDEPKGEKMRIDQPHLSVKVADESQESVDNLVEDKEHPEELEESEDDI